MLILQDKPDEKFFHTSGLSFSPVATFKDDDGFVSHIYIHDDCYCIAVPCSWNVFTTATHIFKEAHDVLKKLPSLKGNALFSNGMFNKEVSC